MLAFTKPRNSADAYMTPSMLNISCSLVLFFSEKNQVKIFEIKKQGLETSFYFWAHILEPICQKTMPNRSEVAIVVTKRTTLCSGFFQYDLCCFHKHAMHWDLKLCQYPDGKFSSCEFGVGLLSLSTSSTFSLWHKVSNQIINDDLVFFIFSLHCYFYLLLAYLYREELWKISA